MLLSGARGAAQGKGGGGGGEKRPENRMKLICPYPETGWFHSGSLFIFRPPSNFKFLRCGSKRHRTFVSLQFLVPCSPPGVHKFPFYPASNFLGSLVIFVSDPTIF